MPITTLMRAAIGIGLLAAALVAGDGRIAPARAGTGHEIAIVDFAFAPAELTIAVGETVTWTNMDPAVHTATATGGAFDSGDLDQGESFSFTFTTAGTYDYLCTPHPFMTGRIAVQAAAAPPPPTPVPTATPASAAGSPLPNVAMPAPRSPVLPIIGVAFLAAALVTAALRLRPR